MAHDSNRTTQEATLLKEIRHRASRLFKGLPPLRIIEEVRLLRDLCNDFLMMLESK